MPVSADTQCSILVRGIPRHLRRRLRLIAKRQGLSLNRFIAKHLEMVAMAFALSSGESGTAMWDVQVTPRFVPDAKPYPPITGETVQTSLWDNPTDKHGNATRKVKDNG